MVVKAKFRDHLSITWGGGPCGPKDYLVGD